MKGPGNNASSIIHKLYISYKTCQISPEIALNNLTKYVEEKTKVGFFIGKKKIEGSGSRPIKLWLP